VPRGSLTSSRAQHRITHAEPYTRIVLKPRILVIDDNPDQCAVLQEFLNLDGFEATSAANGVIALRKLEEQYFDAIATDVFMPEKDGLELIAEVKRLYPRKPVVAISGFGRPASRRTADYLLVAQEVGADALLRKPFDPHELSAILRRLIAAVSATSHAGHSSRTAAP
jgi:CheY-like chemotaxis protein